MVCDRQAHSRTAPGLFVAALPPWFGGGGPAYCPAGYYCAVRRTSLRFVNSGSVRLSAANRAFDSAARLQTLRVHGRDCVAAVSRVVVTFHPSPRPADCRTIGFNRAAAHREEFSSAFDGARGGRGDRADQETHS